MDRLNSDNPRHLSFAEVWPCTVSMGKWLQSMERDAAMLKKSCRTKCIMVQPPIKVSCCYFHLCTGDKGKEKKYNYSALYQVRATPGPTWENNYSHKISLFQSKAHFFWIPNFNSALQERKRCMKARKNQLHIWNHCVPTTISHWREPLRISR